MLSIQRKSKLRFYARAISQHWLVPDAWYRRRLERKLSCHDLYDSNLIQERVNYYYKPNTPFTISDHALSLNSIPSSKQTAYYYDIRALLRYFPKTLRVDYTFGDVRDTADRPTLVKSREISDTNGNNILLKFNQVRHFMPIQDKVRFQDKKDLLVWRGAGWQQHRKDFLAEYWNHSLCDVGQVNPPVDGSPAEWVKPKMSVSEQLQYKYILSIEGNDVATNLKWIAQSNSLCFMTRPKFETWMMEGRLIPGTHYVELRADYADLPEKIRYYQEHPDEALGIIENLKSYYRPFGDSSREELISLLTMKKYAELSGQLDG